MTLPRVHVIHRRIDQERADFVATAYAKAKLDFEFLDAIDGHDPAALQAHKDLIPEHFWGTPQIKPGALGCFLSHRRAWQTLLESNAPFAVIAEDDTTPSVNFADLWPKIEAQIQNCDLLFLNDRTASWTEKAFASLDACITQDETTQKISSAKRAPGGDGYAISRSAAEHLINLSAKTGAFCGVDWFMIGAFWHQNSVHIPSQNEFRFIKDNIPPAPKGLKAKLSRDPAFTLKKGMSSAIQHRELIDIVDLKKSLN